MTFRSRFAHQAKGATTRPGFRLQTKSRRGRRFRPLFVEPLEDRWLLTLFPGGPLAGMGDQILGPGPESEPEGAVIRVDGEAAGLNNGTTWADAFSDLQAALAVAQPGDEIWVAEGTYKPTSGSDRTVAFGLKSEVRLFGGFAGFETARVQRDWSVHLTTLSGDIGIPGDDSDNSHNVLRGSGVADVLVDGFTVTGGNGHSGGGMYVYASRAVTVANVTFAENSAAWGGGMCAGWGTSRLINVTFRENLGGWGGGLAIQGDATTLTKVSFLQNSASSNGGGLVVMGGSATLTHATFVQNSARNGGGLANYSPALTLTDATFVQNTAGQGGGMYTQLSSPTLTNVTFSQNSADWGGALNTWDGTPALTNVTLAQNSASIKGGGIWNGSQGPVLANCILWGNTAGWGDAAIGDSGGSRTTVSYSIVQGGWPGLNNLSVDPLFVDVAAGDLRLQPGSPAIDFGTGTGAPGLRSGWPLPPARR